MRAQLAIATISLLSLYAAAQLYVPRTGPRDDFRIAELRKRFKVLEGVVLPDTRLGYVSDQPLDTGTMFGLEYAIAPRMLVKDSVPHKFVLGNFTQLADHAEFGAARGLKVLREFPNGVVLYERQPGK
jgi:hypothetical protein